MGKKILIFGGSGFVGTSLTKKLLAEQNQLCVVCTNPPKALDNIGEHQNLTIKTTNIFRQDKLQKLVKDYDVVINLIGKLYERKKGDFDKFHYEFPKSLIKYLDKKQHFIHISALSVETSAQTSLYAKTKLAAQNEISKNCNNYNIIKPSIVYGEKDNFFNLFAKITKISPFLPLIGGGTAKFAPIYVEDLNNAILTLINDNEKYQNKIFEAYGNNNASFKELMQFILATLNKKRFLINLPFSIAKIEAQLFNLLHIYLLTADQVELLKYDNIASNKYNNIDKIIGNLQDYQLIVPKYLK